MKKVLSVFVLVLLCSLPSWGQRFSAINADGDTLYYRITRNIAPRTVEVVSGENSEYRDVIVIPDTVRYYGKSYAVTSIGEKAFESCTSLASISIPSSITSIGQEAFSYCRSLYSISIPSSVTSIGASAFESTRNVVYHGTATGSPWGASHLNGYVEGDLVYIDNAKDILIACSATATSVTIPSSVTSIGSRAFYGCTSLTTISIPSSVTYIGDWAFRDCTSLTSVSIPSSVTSLGGTFYGCTSLTSVTIPSSVTSIGYGAFWYCTSLTSVTIPSSVTSIGDWAFSDCTHLTSVTIPSSVTSIGYRAFWDCTSLTSVTIPPSVTSIEGSAFYHVKNVIYHGTAQGSLWGALSNQDNYTEGNLIYSDSTKTTLLACFVSATSVSIPSSVTSIGEYAFEDCTGLTSVSIPSSVTSLNNTFRGCTSLTTVSIPSSVTSLDNTFRGCTSLASVSIPSSVTSLDDTFSGCTSLTSVSIPSSVTSLDGTFGGCTSLTSVSIPSSVTYIRSSTFYGCTGLTSVSIPSSVTSMSGYNTFGHCTNLTSVSIPSTIDSLGSWAFYDCTSLTSVTVPFPVSYIGEDAFGGVEHITYHGSASGSPWGAYSVNGYTEGDLIYSDNTKTTVIHCAVSADSVTLPNTVTTIGTSAFSKCSSLSHIILQSATPPAWTNSYSGYPYYRDLTPFDYLPEGADIRVPCGSANAYQTNEDWRVFSNAIHEDTMYVTDEVLACDGYTWRNGVTYLTDAHAVSTLVHTAGACDSLITLSLTIRHSNASTTADTACASYQWHGRTFFSSAVALDTLTNAAQCDSVTTLHLIVHPTYSRTSDLNLCSNALPYRYGDSTFAVGTADGLYPVHFNTIHGCDSTVNVNLSIKPLYHNQDALTLCDNALPYHYGDSTFAAGSASGTRNVMFHSAFGCDSAIALALTVHPTYAGTDAATLCQSSLPFTYGTSTFGANTASGTYSVPFQTVHHCDSTIALTLTVNPVYNRSDQLTLCDDALPYHYGDSTFAAGSTSGTRPVHFRTVADCDSTVNVALTVHATYAHSGQLTLCDNALPYHYGDSTFAAGSASGTRQVMFHSRYGCDSVMSVALTVHPTYTGTDNATLCQSSLPFTYGGSTFGANTTSGTYNVPFQTVQHCDSTVALTLSVNPTYAGSDQLTLCDNALPYHYGDSIFAAGSASGSRPVHFSTIANCDSLVTVALTVNPTYAGNDQVTLCDDALPFTYGDSTLTSGGSHAVIFLSQLSCDSVITLALTVNPTYHQDDQLILCQSSLPYTYGGTTFDEHAETGSYVLSHTSSQGCDSIITLGLRVRPSENTQLCMVTVENNHNKVVWQKEAAIERYNIYREGDTTYVYDLVHSAAFSDDGSWTDSTSDSRMRSYRYRIASVDSCGVESPQSLDHKTMHLTISQGVESSWNLVWTEYEGTGYSSYRIYRGPDANNLVQIATLPTGGNTSYTDMNVHASRIYYQVVIVLDEPCDNAKASSEVRSNIATNGSAGINATAPTDWTVRAEKGALVVTGAEGCTLRIYDAWGRLLTTLTQASDSERYAVPAAGAYMVQANNAPAKKITVIR